MGCTLRADDEAPEENSEDKQDQLSCPTAIKDCMDVNTTTEQLLHRAIFITLLYLLLYGC